MTLFLLESIILVPNSLPWASSSTLQPSSVFSHPFKEGCVTSNRKESNRVTPSILLGF